MSGENLDLSSDPSPQARSKSAGSPSADSSDNKKFIGVNFSCCDVYTRIYVNPEGTAYCGNCPKCAKRLKILIGPGGTETRFFTAY